MEGVKLPLAVVLLQPRTPGIQLVPTLTLLLALKNVTIEAVVSCNAHHKGFCESTCTAQLSGPLCKLLICRVFLKDSDMYTHNALGFRCI